MLRQALFLYAAAVAAQGVLENRPAPTSDDAPNPYAALLAGLQYSVPTPAELDNFHLLLPNATEEDIQAFLEQDRERMEDNDKWTDNDDSDIINSHFTSITNNDASQEGSIKNTKINDRGEVINPMPKTEYNRIVKKLKYAGVEVFAAVEGDDYYYMRAIEAEGTYSNGRITHIGEIPSRGTLIEEIIHYIQSKRYGELNSLDYIELYAREIEANRMLLKYRDKYKLDALDVADIKRNLAYWESSFERETGMKYDESNYRR